jgi:flagellar protein FliO/FliZ
VVAESYFKFLAATLIVLGLIALATFAIRRFGLIPGVAPLKPKHLRRLRVEEALTIDPRRRLMLLRHDDQEHLILLGPGNDLLISSRNAAEARQETTP